MVPGRIPVPSASHYHVHRIYLLQSSAACNFVLGWVSILVKTWILNLEFDVNASFEFLI